MKNVDVIKNFINGGKGKTEHLGTDGEILINYSTRIAKNVNGTFYVNMDKYSRTTSKIQNALLRELDGHDFKIVTEEQIYRV